MVKFGLADVDYEGLKTYPFPEAVDKKRLDAIGAKAKELRDKNDKYVMLGSCLYEPGLFQACEYFCGFTNVYEKLYEEPEYIERLVDILTEKDIEAWTYLLSHYGKNLDVVIYTDDFSSQNTLIISKDMVRKFFLPKYQKIFSVIKKYAPHIKILFHCCGAAFELIPLIMEMGADILNPLQISASGMDLAKIKKTFGKDLIFWGGGIDTQRVLPFGTPQEVEDAVKRSLDALAPGGGYVFNTVHCIQPEVPPQNIMRMIETLQKYGGY
jgi:uroporphyrinogen decarboxylase